MNFPSSMINNNGNNGHATHHNGSNGLNGNRNIVDNHRSSVCIVGAGAAGLCALRHFTAKSNQDLFESVVCFEQTDSIGGTWNYTEKTGHDKNGLPIHSSMYRNLRTNLPMSLMEFPDFKSNCPVSFVHHTEVLRYLVDYGHHYEVVKYIKFNHQIVNITRNQTDSGWLVMVNDILNRRLFHKTFDIIILANGRYSVPFWPEISRMDRFKGTVLHSHDYRSPEPFAGQRVVVIGGQSSGIDISIELLQKAKQIILVNRSEYLYKNLPDNVVQINANAKEMGPNSITFILNNNGSNETEPKLVEYEIDTLIFATGYQFSLNCLDQESCGITINPNGTIDGLYRHFINIKYPSMLVMAVCQRIIPFPFYHLQLMYYLRILQHEVPLPSVDKMWREVEEDISYRKSEGLREKDRHLMKVEMMEAYLRLLIKEGRLEPLRNVIFKLYADLYRIRCENILHYKDNNYRLIDDENYVEIAPAQKN